MSKGWNGETERDGQRGTISRVHGMQGMLSLGSVKGFWVAFKIKTTNIEVHNVVIDSSSFVAHEYAVQGIEVSRLK